MRKMGDYNSPLLFSSLVQTTTFFQKGIDFSVCLWYNVLTIKVEGAKIKSPIPIKKFTQSSERVLTNAVKCDIIKAQSRLIE